MELIRYTAVSEGTATSRPTSPLKRLLAILRGILDELSDQNAYRRYLTAHRVEHSPATWRGFQDQHWQAKARRGRCWQAFARNAIRTHRPIPRRSNTGRARSVAMPMAM